MARAHWHFPRTALAEHYLNVFDVGISSHLAFIAPRRKGKTAFILQDLAPAAQQQGYLCVYASLWGDPNAPHESIVQALEQAIDACASESKIKRMLSSKVRKAAISNEMLGRVEVEFANNPKSAGTRDLTRIDDLVTQLEKAAKDRTILLLIDEIQHLATSDDFSGLAHSLRTLLDRRQGRVKSIYTGSSRHYMHLLMSTQSSPFYHFANLHRFPDLGEDFCAFLQNKMASEYGVAVAMGSLVKAFGDLDHSPYWMQRLVERLVTEKCPLREAMNYTLELLDAAEGFEETAKTMKPVDRLVFLEMADNGNPFSRALLSRIEAQTSNKGIPGTVQRALARLMEASLVSQIKKGEYHIEKPGLRRYLEKQVGSAPSR